MCIRDRISHLQQAYAQGIGQIHADKIELAGATLDELQGADLLVHVIDVSNERFEEQIAAVEKILEELGIGDKPSIRVFNKADRFDNKELLAALCRRFDAVVLAISADLPFAQGRFCTAEGIEGVVPLSAFRSPTFAKDYGVLITDGPLAGLTARAVVVIDENDKVIYSELVGEIVNEPNYEAALASLR